MSRQQRGPTALHFAAIVLTITTLVLLAGGFVFHREAEEQRGVAARAEVEREKLVAQVRDLDDRIQVLKDVLGYANASVGQFDDRDASTVVGAAHGDITRLLGREPSSQPISAREALASLARERDNLMRERDALVESKSTVLANYRALEGVWKAMLKPEREARVTAERSLQSTVREREEVLASKEREIDNLRGVTAEQRDQIADLEQALDEQGRKLAQRFALHKSTVRRLNRMLQGREAHRFETSDGKITLVDDAGTLVWVDLGSADKLRPGIRFSVFDRGAEQAGGSRKGLKGVVEITRVTGPHRAQARAIQRSRRDPLLAGDLIFSPIWSVGHTEEFALVGAVDLNDDGRSDIESLRRYVAESGAKISVYVNDTGQRVGGAVDLRVKYLVVGAISEPGTAKTDSQRTYTTQLIGHLTAMREEAYDHGVRVIRLNDFLAYIGYTKGLGTGLSVTREPEPLPAGDSNATTPAVGGAGKRSPLRPSRRTPPAGVSGRFRNARGVGGAEAPKSGSPSPGPGR